MPQDIRHAIKMHVATLYRFRESVTEGRADRVPQALDDIYRMNALDVGMG